MRAYDRERQLLAVLDVTDEPSGNGQRLRQQGTNALAEWIALHVIGFSRATGYFSIRAVANDWPEQGLQALEALAFEHRFNRTAAPALMLEAQVPVIEHLQASLHTFAERPALNIAGSRVTYRQLLVQALAIQQRLRPLLEDLDAQPVVGDRKSVV